MLLKIVSTLYKNNQMNLMRVEHENKQQEKKTRFRSFRLYNENETYEFTAHTRQIVIIVAFTYSHK